jgi:hypothetical protein
MVEITARAHRQTLAIHPTVIVVSARKRAAKTNFTESPLSRVLRSASCHRPSFNSSARISSASASAVSARSSP